MTILWSTMKGIREIDDSTRPWEHLNDQMTMTKNRIEWEREKLQRWLKCYVFAELKYVFIRDNERKGFEKWKLREVSLSHRHQRRRIQVEFEREHKRHIIGKREDEMPSFT